MKLILPLLLAACLPSKADTLTISVTNLATVSYAVPSNVVAHVLFAECYGGNSQLLVTVNNTTTTAGTGSGSSNFGQFSPANLPTVVGPAIIALTNSSGFTTCSFCTIQTSPAVALPTIQAPGTAVVIPNDTNGPVTIILESSTDLVNWTAALPGTYGTTASNRFFRVRASR